MSEMYKYAKELYAKLGVDTEKAIADVIKTPISIQCWQGDDVHGFETPDTALSGGIQTTGNYPGRANSLKELRDDFKMASSVIPGTKKISLHEIYLDTLGEKVERNNPQPKHFDSWIDWAKENKFGIDFNTTFFSHPYADSGFTLSHPDDNIREYWIEHAKACRKIAAYMGEKTGIPVFTNHWTPDGFKDLPIDRLAYRARLKDSYDKIFAVKYDPAFTRDSVESKLFGIGAESCTIGSSEFYMGYAAKNGCMLTLDTGHFHPTEQVSDKITACLLFVNELLLHVSRPVRWDSDHVVIFDDELKYIAQEIVRNGFEDRVHIGLDYFDASINRIACWVIGTRNMQKALLCAKLEPTALLRSYEEAGDFTSRLAMLEELKSCPFSAVWDELCERENVPVGNQWIAEVKNYEKKVLAERKINKKSSEAPASQLLKKNEVPR